MTITINNLDSIYKAKICSIETMQLKGYELVDNIMVDNSGFGSDNEPAYTASQFELKLRQLLNKHGQLTAKITDVGQFQVYVGLFTKTGKSKVKKIANNTYEVDYETSTAIRLHDTDILVFEGDHVTLNSGGWHSKTTRDRINQYLPSAVSLVQRNFEWYVLDNRDGTTKDFIDGMTIAS